MVRRDFFCKWLKEHTPIAQSSIEKYSGAINTISEELMHKGLIDKHLYEISDSVQAEKAKSSYFSVKEYIEKDERGNRMYSRALIYYIEFLQSNN
jgi:5-methylcytosine-specific restriction enzyme A